MGLQTKRLVAAAVTVFVGVAGAVAWAVRDGKEDRPNVLVIITDDQRANHVDVMTRTRRVFADGGRRFTNAYASTPLCCPSRASIFNGRYTHNHKVLNNTAADAARFDEANSVQRYLHAAGYQTGLVGKYLNSWDVRRRPANFDTWTLYTERGVSVDGEVTTEAGFTGDALQGDALRVLRRFEQDDDRPWLLYLTPLVPHRPYVTAPQDAAAAVTPDDVPAEVDLSDKPPELRAGRQYGTAPDAVSVAQQRSLLSLDRMIEEIFTHLDRTGENNTLAIFTSDNGYLVGDHGIVEDKRMPYTGSVLVPMLLRWPGRVAPGGKDDRLVLNVDIAPTVLSATGVDVPDDAPNMDGHSLLHSHRRDVVLLEYFKVADESPTAFVSTWASYRTAREQYIEWYDAGGRTRWRELYDLVRDPSQLESTVRGDAADDDPRVRPRAARLARLKSCAGTSGAGACP